MINYVDEALEAAGFKYLENDIDPYCGDIVEIWLCPDGKTKIEILTNEIEGE
jgi:hypothetical protein